MDSDFAKKLRNFEKVWARVQGAKGEEKPKTPNPPKKPCQKRGQRGRGRRF